MDIQKIGENQFHLLHKTKSYHIEVLHTDWEKKTLKLKINGQQVETKYEHSLEKTLQKLGLENIQNQIQTKIFAPMPGLILNVLVKKDQSISKGDPLAIIEAMKMENIIKATFDGSIEKVHISNNDKVDKNDLLFELKV